jgi:hypothetical protein
LSVVRRTGTDANAQSTIDAPGMEVRGRRHVALMWDNATTSLRQVGCSDCSAVEQSQSSTRSLLGDVKGNAIGVDDVMVHTFPLIRFVIFASCSIVASVASCR